MKRSVEYWLISYAMRRHGRAEWSFENDAYKGRVVAWIREMQQYENEAEHRFISAHPITAGEYKWLNENT